MCVAGEDAGAPQIGSILTGQSTLAGEPGPHAGICDFSQVKSVFDGELLKVEKRQFGAKIGVTWDYLDQSVTILPGNSEPFLAVLMDNKLFGDGFCTRSLKLEKDGGLVE